MDVVVVVEMWTSLIDGQPWAYTEAGARTTWGETPLAYIACSYARRTNELLYIHPFDIVEQRRRRDARRVGPLLRDQDDMVQDRWLMHLRCFCCGTVLLVGNRKCPMCHNGTPPKYGHESKQESMPAWRSDTMDFDMK